MNVFIDWDCRLLPGFDHLGNPQDARLALEILNERSGITRFCFFPELDPVTDSSRIFLLRRDAALENLTSLLPECFRLRAFCKVTLRKDLLSLLNPQKLLIPGTNYLAVSIPLESDPLEMENELGHLVHRSKMHLLLTAAELVRVRFPKDSFERILHLPNMAFSFHYRSVCDPEICRILLDLHRRKVPVVFGSAVSTPEKAGQFDFSHYIESAKNTFSLFDFEDLFYRNRMLRKKQYHTGSV